MKKLLLTGATGFVGRQVLRALEGKNVQMRCVLREGGQSRLSSPPNLEKNYLTGHFCRRYKLVGRSLSGHRHRHPSGLVC